ncbi:MAG: L-rhamnose isomerase [Clostridia bacterium]|nr:L-rhamnose isomerase [Clostridia bacterium]
MSNITKAYELARERYAALGIDTDKVIEKVLSTPLSMHCWQGDDVTGFENVGGALSGGIQVTGNYPGKARTPEELRADIDKAFSLIPGEKKVNIHAFYLEADEKVDRDAIEPKHFDNWIDWANQGGFGLDFNPTCFSHPYSEDGYTLSSGNETIRKFWVEHCIRSRQIAEYIGKKTGKICVNNIWVPDGAKDNVADRFAPRARLAQSLDEIFAVDCDPAYEHSSLESKVFGIGSEAYVVGSHEFYMGYAMKNNKMLTLDLGHYHPTESVADKISSILLFSDKVLFHVSRPMRWDSDHVVIMNDDLMNIANELVRNDFLDRTYLALDYFDGSINRVAAWVIGMRNTRKALLRALLEPSKAIRELEYAGDHTGVLALTEEAKAMPWAAVWDYLCEKCGMPVGSAWLDEVRAYEKSVLAAR